MKTTKRFVESGAGCCLLLPLIGLSASASEPSQNLSSSSLPYPVVGLDASSIETGLNQTGSDLFYPNALFLSEERPFEASSVPSTNKLPEFNGSDHVPLNSSSEFTVLAHQPPLLAAPNEDFYQLSLPLESLQMAETPVDGVTPTGVESTTNLSSSEQTVPEQTVSEQTFPKQTDLEKATETPNLGLLSVSLQDYQRRQLSTLIKGAENGHQAVAFDQWLLPFDDVNQALGFSAAVTADGQWELRSSQIVTRVPMDALQTDADLGLVWSIADIETYLGAIAHFDIATYTIQLNQSALNQPSNDPMVSYQSELDPSVLDARQATENTTNSFAADTLPAPNTEVSTETVSDSTATDVTFADDTSSLGVLLVGLAIENITTIEATLVKGRENGEGAVSLDQWLIPFDDAMAALGIAVSVQDDGQFSLRSPGIVTLLDPASLSVDPDLGLVISIAQIESRLGIPAQFSMSNYAIRFMPPQTTSGLLSSLTLFPSRATRQDSLPVETEGLPIVNAPNLSLSGLRQSVRLSAGGEGFQVPTAETAAVGTLFGGSWYAEIDQPSFTDHNTWTLNELQYLRQGDRTDYVLGSQPTFWRSLQPATANTGSDFWGFTTVQRSDYSPQASNASGFSPTQRLRSAQIGRTIAGEAPPGTLVQLTRSFSDFVIEEQVVDSSGIYRFDDVPVIGTLSSQSAGPTYQVKLYENGLLNQLPEVRSATFVTLPGQLPKGASALIASAGVQRESTSQSFIGRFERLQGGVAVRHGLTESLTLGTGLVQGKETQLLAEGLYLPDNVPFHAAFSALMSVNTGETQVNADVRYQPTRDLKFSYRRNRFSDLAEASWRVSPDLTLSLTGDMRDDDWSIGGRFSRRIGQWFGSADLSIDTEQNVRWNVSANNRQFRLSSRGNEVSTYSEAAYRFQAPTRTSNPDFSPLNLIPQGLGHEISLSHETYRFNFAQLSGITGRQLTTARWRYQSPPIASDGRRPWSAMAGYAFSDIDSGPVLSVGAALTPGLEVELSYQGVSAFSTEDSFRLSLVSSLRSRRDNRSGISWASRHQNRLRTQGGLLVQPFFDANANGLFDEDETLYLDSPELLLKVNNHAVSTGESEIQPDGVLVMLPPETYRLDIDPTGLPLDTTTAESAYAVDIMAGQYTAVRIPLMTAYTVSGVVTGPDGSAVAGARVEAISPSGARHLSITNGAGVYYLERLQPASYDITINGEPIALDQLSLENEADPFQVRDFHLI